METVDDRVTVEESDADRDETVVSDTERLGDTTADRVWEPLPLLDATLVMVLDVDSDLDAVLECDTDAVMDTDTDADRT